MVRLPKPPPESEVLKAAYDKRKEADRKYSLREVARRVGLTEGRVRQILSGYDRKTPRGAMVSHAPDDTLADLAFELGIQLGELAAAGRPEADEILHRKVFDHAFIDAMDLQQQIQDWAQDPLVVIPPAGILSLFDEWTLNRELERRRNQEAK